MNDLFKHVRNDGQHVLKVKVIPRSSRNEIVGNLDDGTWKIRLKAVPEHNKANEALCAFLAKELHLRTSDITILSGHTTSIKRLKISL